MAGLDFNPLITLQLKSVENMLKKNCKTLKNALSCLLFICSTIPKK